MALKHEGTIDELKEKLDRLGHPVREQKDIANGYQVRTQTKLAVNFFTTTGSLNVQAIKGGSKERKEELEALLQDEEQDFGTGSDVKDQENTSNKIFVVYGHDDKATRDLQLILHKLGLEPFVLGSTSGSGLTIIENLESQFSDPQKKPVFAIVLLTPDDMGYAKSESEQQAKPRARQNVIFEMGMLMARLGRQNVAIIRESTVEVPSDAQGVIYHKFDNEVREVVHRLASHLRDVGVKFREEGESAAASGL